ncbi:hypothetical protein HNR00_001001 [Methylorubrum rhodinum]|uniref:Uncharacterized protein n=1 Tax=Methylorubrum rhodinum TaxID=29428 RepID=A0A840ZHF5_9HYPH|nr:hypothetical protein [Methylorubrum rhodinum]
MHRITAVLRAVLRLVLAGAQAKASGLRPQEARVPVPHPPARAR